MPDPRETYAAKEEILEESALEHACDVLIANCEGVLCFDEAEVPIKYILDHEDGRLVASVPVASILATENILHVPEMNDDALHLLLTPEQIDDGAVTDRWQAYHHEPEHVRWAAYWIDSAKHGPWVFDGDGLLHPNPLAADQGALCKLLNADVDALRAMCKARAHVEVEQPTAVGVDPLGIHIRARFGVVRVRFPKRVESVGEAREAIGELG